MSCSDGCTNQHSNKLQTISLILSGISVGFALIFNWTGLVNSTIITLLAILGILLGGWFLVPSAWKALVHLRPNISLLMLIAVIGASIIGEWVEAATVVFLFGVAEWLESWADRKSHRAIEALLDIAPKVALVRQGNKFVETKIDEVKVGDYISVKSDLSIPLDGIIISGESSINQAPITGESVPVDKKAGDAVFAGTINGEGSLEIQVTKLSTDSTLAKIIRLVKAAQEQKAPSQKFVDTFAKYYTPTVTIVAILVFIIPPLLFGGLWTEWLYRACVLLIIACPCALVISTPVSIVSGMTALARKGVLVKGGAHLENIAKLKAIALDKTGTITEGRPSILNVYALGKHREKEVLHVAASIDVHSSHPLAKAIVSYVTQKNISFKRAVKYTSISGRGAHGIVDNHIYFVGNHRLAHELGICTPDVENQLSSIEAKGQSVIIVGHKPHHNCAGEVVGIIAVGDSIKKNAESAIETLHDVGVQKIVMLSGDNSRVANFVAKQVGIDQAQGDLLPEDKVATVKALRIKYSYVAMVGDGVNDAPAMAEATVGIAMGSVGTDAAIETADVTLMNDDLSSIAEAINLSQRMSRIIRFNIGFALSLKTIFLILTLSGVASLWFAILSDTGATLLVIANSMRLLK
jgi:Zn2+/Cd2+-exporting ATPase